MVYELGSMEYQLTLKYRNDILAYEVLYPLKWIYWVA